MADTKLDDAKRATLTLEEAEAMLPDGDNIHTFVNPSGALVGADWRRSKVLDAFGRYTVELSGALATQMGHGLVFHDGSHHVFVATKEPPNDPDEIK